jgi:hypothetical protein
MIRSADYGDDAAIGSTPSAPRDVMHFDIATVLRSKACARIPNAREAG